MLVQPSRTATVCEVDRARKRAASRKRAQNLGYRTNNRWRFITPKTKTIHLTLTCSCEACSAFTRVAARTLAPSPIRDQLHRRLQPFRHLHDCSGCFRLERSPGGACTHWKAPPSHGAHVKRPFRIATVQVPVGRGQGDIHVLPTGVTPAKSGSAQEMNFSCVDPGEFRRPAFCKGPNRVRCATTAPRHSKL